MLDFIVLHDKLRLCLSTLLLFLVPVTSWGDDNVIALEENIEYTLQGADGRISSVKKRSETTYKAVRVDDSVIATEMFGDHKSIDKASAPGARPYYRSWEPTDMFHTGTRICLLDVPLSVGKPAKVCFESTQKWPEQFCNIFLASPCCTQSSNIRVRIPKALASRYSVAPYRLPDTMMLEKSVGNNGDVVYSVLATDRQPLKPEPYAPSSAIDCPQLIIKGHFADIDELYAYLKGFVPDDDSSCDELESLSQRLVSTCDSPVAKIDSVAAWVRQNIRYVAIENGEYALRPASPREVLERRYGDCKGSANLIKALLCKSGIDARLVWVGTHDEVPTDWVSNPSLLSGNHQIACAVLPDTVIYIDGTVSYASDGFVPPSIRGAKVIIENGEQCMISEIPHDSRGVDGERLKSRLAVDGCDLVGQISRTYTGSERVGVVEVWNSLDIADKVTLQERLLTFPKKNLGAAKTEFLLAGPSAAECCIYSEKTVDRNAVRKVGDRLYVCLTPFRISGLESVETKDRTRGLELQFNTCYFAEIVLEIPEGYVPDRLPETAVIDSGMFSGKVEYVLDGSTIVCRATLSSGHPEIPLNRIGEYNEEVKAVNRLSNAQIILKRTDKTE